MKLSDHFVLRTDRSPDDPGVYLIRRAADGLYKIGMSRRLPERVATIRGQCGGAAELVLVVRCADPRAAERLAHVVFKAFRVEGEWFALSEVQVEFLRSRFRRPAEKGRGE